MLLIKRIFSSGTFWLFLITLFTAVAVSFSSLPDSRLHIYFCNVGQGDALVIKRKNQTVLIDGGPDTESVIKCLDSALPYWERDLDLVILTHPHADHVRGLISVFDYYSVKAVMLAFTPYKSNQYSYFLKKIAGKKTQVIKTYRGQKFKIGELDFSVYWPPRKCLENNVNYCSVVVGLNYQQFSALFTGDFNKEAQNDFNSTWDTFPVLKIPHQGAADALDINFLTAVNPSFGVISVGEKNRYGHPHSNTLQLLSTFGVAFKRTDLDGTVEVVSDGENWRVVGR